MSDFIKLADFDKSGKVVHGFGTDFCDLDFFAPTITDFEKLKKRSVTMAVKKALEIEGFDKMLTIRQCQRENLFVLKSSDKLIPPADLIRCDGIITDIKGILLGIKTADCLSVLISDPVREIVAAVHAGWFGTYRRILLRTLKKMEFEFDSNMSDIKIAFGSSAKSCCYEIGADVGAYFENYDQSVFRKDHKKLYLDLEKINAIQAIDAGVSAENISSIEHCTMCSKNPEFYSYRKQKEKSGRMLNYIGMKACY